MKISNAAPTTHWQQSHTLEKQALAVNPFLIKNWEMFDDIQCAWQILRLRAEDHRPLAPRVVHFLCWVSIILLEAEWKPLWEALCKHGLEDQLERIYNDFYIDHHWLLDHDAEQLALFQQQPYYSPQGRKIGTVELVRGQARVGMRVVIPYRSIVSYSPFAGRLIIDACGTPVAWA
jgi:hypothetical protein